MGEEQEKEVSVDAGVMVAKGVLECGE